MMGSFAAFRGKILTDRHNGAKTQYSVHLVQFSMYKAPVTMASRHERYLMSAGYASKESFSNG